MVKGALHPLRKSIPTQRQVEVLGCTRLDIFHLANPSKALTSIVQRPVFLQFTIFSISPELSLHCASQPAFCGNSDVETFTQTKSEIPWHELLKI